MAATCEKTLWYTLEHHISPGFERIVFTDGYEFVSREELDERLRQLKDFYGEDRVTALDKLYDGDTMIVGIIMTMREALVR